MNSFAIEVAGVNYSYGDRRALDGLDLQIGRGEIFGFLGPNGGGKSTLFRLLSTLAPPQAGQIRVLGLSLPSQMSEVRRRLGVVFQSPSLDRKLTVAENLACHASLYGLTGAALRSARDDALEQFGLTPRAGDLVETLSGGLRRRVELAQSLMHRPELLLLDEPSTGLDPGARLDLWNYLAKLRAEHGMTIALTTHLLEEADKVDRLAILDLGRIVATGTPGELRASVGGETLTIATADAQRLASCLREQLGLVASPLDGAVRVEVEQGAQRVAEIVGRFPDQIMSVTWGRPTLEDVFIARTGHRFETQ